jgi:hypothetical protein
MEASPGPGMSTTKTPGAEICIPPPPPLALTGIGSAKTLAITTTLATILFFMFIICSE